MPGIKFKLFLYVVTMEKQKCFITMKYTNNIT